MLMASGIKTLTMASRGGPCLTMVSFTIKMEQEFSGPGQTMMLARLPPKNERSRELLKDKNMSRGYFGKKGKSKGRFAFAKGKTARHPLHRVHQPSMLRILVRQWPQLGAGIDGLLCLWQ